MEAVMNLLATLRVDHTTYYQFAIFSATFVPLYIFIFKPYYEAYNERLERTEGNQESSQNFLSEADELKTRFEAKTREINEQYKKVYDGEKKKTQLEYDQLINEAREQAQKQIDGAQVRVQTEMKQASAEITLQVPQVCDQIVAKLAQ